MTDQELLQAIGQVVETVVEAKMEPLRQDIRALREDVQKLQHNQETLGGRMDQVETKVDGVRVYLDVELHRTLNLLLEGQQALWNRFVPRDEVESLEDRTAVLELTVKRHSQEIRQLQYA